MLRLKWEGHYFSGRDAGKRRAQIVILPNELRIIFETGEVLKWPLVDIRQTQGHETGEPVRLEHGKEYGEAIVIEDQAFLAVLREATDKNLGRFKGSVRGGRWGAMVAGSAVGVVVLGVGMYLWGIPYVAYRMGDHVPVSWEKMLGKSMVGHMAPPSIECRHPEVKAAIGEMTKRLMAQVGNTPYKMSVVVADIPVVNAFALPGGYIVICRGLLEQSDSAEELAGVLAHEIQHVLCRHSTRRILEYASTGLLVTAVAGDVSGIAAFGIEATRTMGLMRYSRHAEAEADRLGLELLQRAKINPAGMVRFFEKLSKKGGAGLEKFKFIMSHPLPVERMKVLRELAASSTSEHVKLLPNVNWNRIKNLCSE